MSNIIYEPRGKAREYSPLAANLYEGCDHMCLYCYVPHSLKMHVNNFSLVRPKKEIRERYEKSARRFAKTKKQVFFSFSTDPYNHAEKKLRHSRFALEQNLKYKIPTAILTKHNSVLNDIDVIKKFNKSIIVGMSLTFDNDMAVKHWERRASTPSEREKCLQTLYENGITTFVSLEPVIDIEQSKTILMRTHEYISHYKIGMYTPYGGHVPPIGRVYTPEEWKDFVLWCIKFLRNKKKDFIIKNELAAISKTLPLLEKRETSYDFYQAAPFEDTGELF